MACFVRHPDGRRAGPGCAGLEERLLGHRRSRVLRDGNPDGGRFCLAPELGELFHFPASE